MQYGRPCEYLQTPRSLHCEAEHGVQRRPGNEPVPTAVAEVDDSSNVVSGQAHLKII